MLSDLVLVDQALAGAAPAALQDAIDRLLPDFRFRAEAAGLSADKAARAARFLHDHADRLSRGGGPDAALPAPWDRGALVDQMIRCQSENAPAEVPAGQGARAAGGSNEGDTLQRSQMGPLHMVLAGLLLLLFAVAAVLAGRLRRGDLSGLLPWRRSLRRHVCDLPVRIVAGPAAEGTRLRDVSRRGCMVERRLDLAARARVTLDLGVAAREGRVIWTNRHYAGIRFDRDLGRDELAALLDTRPIRPLAQLHAFAPRRP